MSRGGRYRAFWRGTLLLPALLAFSRLIAFAAVTDTGIHVPPAYDTLVPPSAGDSYDDPAFGTAIKRVSDAMATADSASRVGLTSISTEYSTASPFNSSGSRLLLLHQSYFALYDGKGRYQGDLPLEVNAASEPRWSRRDPNALYFVRGNSLLKLDVTSAQITPLHTFVEHTKISGRGESEISPDGDHFVFAGDDRYVFVYEISTDRKGPALDTAGRPFDSLYIAGDNRVTIGWNQSGSERFTGIELYDRNMSFQRQLTRSIGHMRLTRDTNGGDVLVWTNSNDPAPLPGCPNAIVKVRLDDAQQTCLLPLPWSLAVHVTAPDGNGWAFVETYAPSNPQPGTDGWAPYTNEILQLRLDGSETRRLLHHRSRPANSYGYQPKSSVSRDGGKLVFTSNYNLQSLLGYPADYTDAYLVTIPTR